MSCENNIICEVSLFVQPNITFHPGYCLQIQLYCIHKTVKFYAKVFTFYQNCAKHGYAIQNYQ